jgi:hypothetical protein
MNAILAWIKSKNISTHVIIVFASGLACTVAADPALQAWIKTALPNHPTLTSFIVLASIAWAKQSHSSSPAGTVANAKAILAQPNAPSAAQVESATTAK